MLSFLLPLVCIGMLHSQRAAADNLAAIEKGRTVASRACASCHSIGLRGDSPVADAAPFRDLVSRWSGEEIENALKTGLSISHRAKMVSQIADADADALIAFLRSLAEELAGE